MIRRWLAARRERFDAAVLAVLRDHPGGGTVTYLWHRYGISPGVLHASLARLEGQGRVRSWWADGPHPRRRIYAVTGPDHSAVTGARCPTCMGRSRRTTGMVCQTCGRDYGPDPDTKEDA